MNRFPVLVFATFLCLRAGFGTETLRPDPAFAPRFENGTGQIGRIVMQPDGKFLVSGVFTGVSASPRETLVRFNADGSPDSTFGPVKVSDVGALVLLGDGRILIGGSFTDVAGVPRARIARLNVDGSLDQAFDTGDGFNDRVTCLAVQGDGRIVVGGNFSRHGLFDRPNLARLEANGSLDTDFQPVFVWVTTIASLAIQSDGKILLGGALIQFPVVGAKHVVRLNADGTHDTTFATSLDGSGIALKLLPQVDGALIVAGTFWLTGANSPRSLVRLQGNGATDATFLPDGDFDSVVSDVVPQSDGRFLVCGTFQSFQGAPRSGAALMTADWTLDSGFVPPQRQEDTTAIQRLDDGRIIQGGHGFSRGFLARLAASGAPDDTFTTTVRLPATVHSAQRLANGQWLVTGDFAFANGVRAGRIARLLASGALDPQFAVGEGFDVLPYAVAEQSDGKLVVTGPFSTYQGLACGSLVRLLADGSRDVTFVPGTDAGAGHQAVALQSSGKILVTGFVPPFNPQLTVRLARLNSDGTRDNTFDSSTIFEGQPVRMLVQADDKIVVAGAFGGGATGLPRGLMRFNANGAPDTSFAAAAGFDAMPALLAPYPGGGLVVAGGFTTYNGTALRAIAKLDLNGVPDPAFAPASLGIANFSALGAAPDGRIWVTGTDSSWALVFRRLGPTGAFDGDFVLAGDVVVDGFRSIAFAADGRPVFGGTWSGVSSFLVGGLVIASNAPVPVITAQPVSRTAQPGATVDFNVTATGEDLQYQWFHDDVAIAGATGATLSLTDVQLAHAGVYRVRVSNAFDTVTSQSVTLGGVNPVPTITVQPGIVTAIDGVAAALQISVNGTGSLSYQWRRAGEAISGATGATLNFAPARFSDAAFYDVVVGDGLSGTISASGRLVVYPEIPANVYRPVPEFGPRLERKGGTLGAMLQAPGGKFYVAGEFSALAGATTSHVARFNADGTPDPAFEPAVVQDGAVKALALQPDGKLLLAGTFSFVGGVPRDGVARLDVDGSLDLSFDTGTGFAGDSTFGEPNLEMVTFQTGGRILVGGRFYSYRGIERNSLLRLNADGSLDEGFVPTAPITGTVYTVVEQTDGKLLVGAFGSIVRLNADGSRDATFDTGSALGGTILAIAPQANGQLLVSGLLAVSMSPTIHAYGIVRLNSDGIVDPTFVSAVGGGASWVNDFVVLGDGRILIGGDFSLEGQGYRHQLARLTATGALEASLADNSDSSQGSGHHIEALELMASGALFATIVFDQNYPSNTNYALWRFAPDGTRDAAFNHAPRELATVRAILALPQGKWAVGGDFRWVDGLASGGLVVLNADGAIDSGFVSGAGFDGAVESLALDGAGRLVVGGSFVNYQAHPVRRIARLQLTGALDASFDAGAGFGGSTSPSGGTGVNTVSILPNGSILAGGDFSEIDGVARMRVAKLGPDGALDTTFAVGTGPDGTVWSSGAYRNGHVVIGGEFFVYDGAAANYALARLDPTGALAGSFETQAQLSRGVALHVLPDESILAAGLNIVARFLPGGAHDPAYDSPENDAMNTGHIHALAVDAGRRAVIGGTFFENPAILLERFLSDGALDPTFRVPGVLPLRVDPQVRALAYGPGAKILVGGAGIEFADTSRGGLVLLEPAPVPTITAPPVNQVAPPGGAAQFSVVATGGGITYQWFHNGRAIAGATSATLALTNVQIVDAGTYHVVLTNVWDVVKSGPATLSGPYPAPTIVTAPASIEPPAGSAASLQVSATGVGELAYQWRKFGRPIAGATTATLPFNPVTLADAGFYDVVIGDGLSVTTSASVVVHVAPPFLPNLLRVKATFAPRLERSNASVSRLAAASDNQYYAAGDFTRVGNLERPRLARFNADGSVDPGFAPPAFRGTVTAMVRQTDGRLIIAGEFEIAGANPSVGLMRLNVDGTLDPTFAPPAEFNTPPYTLVMQPDGRILAGGDFTAFGAVECGRIARLNPDGTLDDTFATGLGFGGAVTDIALQSGGRILVVGSFSSYQNFSVWGIVRLSPTGERDFNFVLPISVGFGSLHVLPDDRIVAAVGNAYSGSPVGYRLTPDGGVELSYASVYGDSGQFWLRDMAVSPDGGIVVAVFARDYVTNRSRGRVARLLATGELDPAFASPFSDDIYLAAVLSLPDGSVIVGGAIENYLGEPANGCLRLHSDGTRDFAATPALRALGSPTRVIPATGGGWWVGGGFNLVDDQPVPGLVRLTEDGTIAMGFAPDPTLRGAVSGLVEQPDGNVVASGSFGGSTSKPDWGVVRFTPLGARDVNFVPTLPLETHGVALTQSPDGALFVSVTDNRSTPEKKRVLRLWSDGTGDSTFQADYSFVNAPQMLAARADGSLFVDQDGITRLRADGAIDPAFSAPTTQGRQVTSAVERLDGKIFVGAMFASNGFPLVWRNLARLNADGSTDDSFALTSPFDLVVTGIVTHPNGEVLAHGVSVFGNDSSPLVRFTADGSVDPGLVIEGFTRRGFVTTANYTAEGGLLLGGDPIFTNYTGRGLVLLEPVAAPVIATPPQSPPSTQAGGSGVTISVGAVGNGDVTYQWQVDHGTVGQSSLAARPSAGFVDVPGATGATLSIPVPQQFHNGQYRVVITANGMSVTSDPVTVSVAAATPSPDARLLNLSTRGLVQTGSNVLIPGFVVSGSVNKKLLIRAVGPTLGTAPFNVPGVLPDPRIVVKRFNPATQLYDVDVANNDNWGTNANFAELKQTAASLSAFTIPDASNDAALLLDLAPGQYTVIADDVASATGIAIVELYDADANGAGSRLINISNRGFVGVGANVMIPGFVVSSEGSKTFLIRAVGPTLAGAPYNVPGTMADPKLTVFQTNPVTGQSTEILAQDNWGENPDAAHTTQIATQVFAFALNTGSPDAAFVVTLPPGLYTVIGASADGTSTGVVLVEVYVVE